MDTALTRSTRIQAEGRFFRKGREKFFIRGVTYGPLAPDPEGQPYGSRDTAARDLDLAVGLGANVVRVYVPPPIWLMDLAWERGLHVWSDLSWPQHVCFLETADMRAQVRHSVRQAIRRLAGHPAVFAYSVGNEIPPDIVRWSGPGIVRRFLEDLVEEVKAVDPCAVCTYGNFPPTEYLQPRNVDFVAFNVYLHDRRAFRNYLDRLQILAGDRPLVLGECGVDALREGEDRQAALLTWQVEEAFRAGLAGFTVFSLTDEWHRGGRPVLDWAMGLTTRERRPKRAWFAVQQQFRQAPRFPLSRWPKVSVVVASFNGARTLEACLASLLRIRYPDYEVILVDDGSADATAEIGARFPSVRVIRHKHNLGLSAARNAGIAAAAGEIVAFTDDDCQADEDWLYYLVQALLESEAVGAGGPNLLPPEDSPVAAAVMASPGGPAAVLLTDRLAEHLPGCNMAFYKWALEAIGGFDPVFRKAGDDVDICWRLLQAGYRLVYAPSACVWHHRRSTVRAYLRQQAGYGEAEALLMRKHPEQFNLWGGSRWRGRIYGTGLAHMGLGRSIIYHGKFGSGWFQTLYGPVPQDWWLFTTALEFHVLVTLPLAVLAMHLSWLGWFALGSFLLTVTTCGIAAARAPLGRAHRRWWSRPLIALLFGLQPVVRGWARYRDRMRWRSWEKGPEESLEAAALRRSSLRLDRVDLWSERPVERLEVLEAMIADLERRGWTVRPDTGWSSYDFEAVCNPWTVLRVVSALELYPEGKRQIRLRIVAGCTLIARVAFGIVLIGSMAMGGLLPMWRPWIWVVFPAASCMAWLFWRRQSRASLSRLALALDAFARDRDLIRLPWQTHSPPAWKRWMHWLQQSWSRHLPPQRASPFHGNSGSQAGSPRGVGHQEDRI
ncbi:MAG: glycosyltransferase [Verrucomicrobiota bacterium]|nr:glycosyltransferase [Limisphaera sp.]MDW8381219.1 glycosyltransferase [Verrucomicrobiota bacterium]